MTKKRRSKKSTGYWLADWANNQGSPKVATYMVTGVFSFVFILHFSFTPEGDLSAFNWFTAFLTVGLGYFVYKLWSGVLKYHCPKCKKIYVGNIYSQSHLGSKQRAKQYRVRDFQTLKYKDRQTGLHKKQNYTIERDETGVEQTDVYHNKVKCVICSHKWEYDSSTTSRVR